MTTKKVRQEEIEFHTLEIESNIRDLLNQITTIQNSTSPESTHQKKFGKWIVQLTSILDQISTLEKEVIPLISKDLGYSFKNKNLIFTAMVRPSLKNTFKEIKDHFKTEPIPGISEEMLGKLIGCSASAQTLAWVGDSAIKYAILLNIWKPGKSTKDLHNTRMKFERNTNLSQLCDEWQLFKYRIHFDPDTPKKESIPAIKGTLVESIFGIIFLEKGIEGVERAIHLIGISD